ncbi:MAG: hypothetical protein JXB49_05465 [Bacteroidales bacterium]|nr:hypothetical protein [Bacteroidales bacterium]
MGGKIGIIMSIAATILLYIVESTILFWISLLTTVIIFWTWGIMHNYAHMAARNRIKSNKINEGKSEKEISNLPRTNIEINETDMDNVPDYLTFINMIITIAAFIFLIFGIIKLLLYLLLPFFRQL